MRPAVGAAAPAAPALSRDGVTLFVYGHLAVYGYFLYGFGPSVPLLRAEQEVSRALSGLHGTAMALGALITGTLGAAAVRRWGRRVMLRVGVLGICAGVVVFTSMTALPATLLGALLAGICGSIVVNAHAPVLAARHGSAGPAAISEANAVASGTGMLAPVAIGAAIAAGVGWRPGLLVTLVLAGIVLVAGRRVAVPEPAPVGASGTPLPTGNRAHAASRRLPRRYWSAWIVLVLLISVEFAITIWASDLLRERVGLSDGAAAGAITAVVTGMTAGRLAGSRLALRHGPDPLLGGTLGVTLLGFTVLWFSTWGWLSLSALFVVGLGLALQFPLGIARALRDSAGRPDLAAARASLGAGLAIGLSPFLLGSLADVVGTHRAFLLVPALLVAAGLVLWYGPDGSRSRRR